MPPLLAQAHPTIQEHIKLPQQEKRIFHFFNTSVYQTSEYGGGGYNISHIIVNYSKEDFEIFLNISPAFGNGINKKFESRGFNSIPSADDTESFVKNINDSGREYILEGWVYFTRKYFGIKAGLIDATSVFDTNEFANDELSQFLNTDLVNNPLSVIPSYNSGVILNISFSKLKFNCGYVEGDPDYKNVKLFQVSYSGKSSNVSVHYFKTQGIEGFGVSVDKEVSNMGFFGRFGKNSERDYSYFLSGGISIFPKGKNNVGIGYAFKKGNLNKDVYVFETYYKYELLKNAHITLDYQRIDDVKEANVLGLRFHVEF